MNLIKGSDLLAVFEALGSLKSIVRDHDPVTVEAVAEAIYGSYGYVRPWEHPATQRIHGPHTRRAAKAAIAALAQAGEAGTAETVEQGSVHEHAVGNADAPKGDA